MKANTKEKSIKIYKYVFRGSARHSLSLLRNAKIEKKSSIPLPDINEEPLRVALNLWKNPLKIFFPADDTHEHFIKHLSNINLYKPLKSHNVFYYEVFDKINPKLNIAEKNSLIAKKWNALSEKAKKSYKEKAQLNNDIYKRELGIINLLLFLGYNPFNKKANTAYNFFKTIQIMIQDIDDLYKNYNMSLKEYEKEIRKVWDTKDDNYKNKYRRLNVLSKKMLNFFIKNSYKITPRKLFINDEYDNAEKNKTPYPRIYELFK